MKKWLCSVASEFVEGLADGFLIISGGASVAQATTQVATVTPLQLLCSVLLAGVWYVAAFIKKNPPPFGQASEQQPSNTPTT